MPLSKLMVSVAAAASSRLMARADSSWICSMRRRRASPQISRIIMARAARAARPAMPRASQPSVAERAKKSSMRVVMVSPAHKLKSVARAETSTKPQRNLRVNRVGTTGRTTISPTGSCVSNSILWRDLGLSSSSRTKAVGLRWFSVMRNDPQGEIQDCGPGECAGRNHPSKAVAGSAQISIYLAGCH